MKNASTFLSMFFVFCSIAFGQTKTVSILGDSYSTFEGFLTPETNDVWYKLKNAPNKTDVSNVTDTWWHQFIRKKGWRLCVNNSYSGSTVCNTGYDGNDYSDRSFIVRMDELGCPDVIFIFGATNDSWSRAPIGEYKFDGITPADLWTFRPAMSYMLSWMQQRYINTEIYFILNDGLSEAVNESVRTICRHYNISVIELKGIHKISGHPSKLGMQQIAEQLASALE